MIFAQTALDPAALKTLTALLPYIITGIVVTVLITLVGAAANIVAIIRVNQTQKREVSFGFEPASKEEFSEHKAHNSRIHDLLFKEIREVSQAANERLREVGERIAGTEREMVMMNQRSATIDSKLDRLIERRVGP